MKKAFNLTIWSTAAFLISANEVFAQPLKTGDTTLLDNPLGPNTTSFTALITKVLDNIITPIGGIVAVFFIIYSGFLFVTAGANETKREGAKKALLYAVIGAAILVGAQAISKIIETTINSLK